MAITILEAFDAGDDVLLIHATADGVVDRIVRPAGDGEPEVEERPRRLEARGWISATTNYFPPDAYQADGQRKRGATARAMTDAERLAYCKERVAEQYPEVLGPPVALGIQG